ncbi:3TM-type holin [Novosphingobium sp.]|uniref:3TM-type holin n=1 Tax=Novosphingobium sp. TaxID=1874826 RepID=UPI001D3AEC44|nr:holin family protein [Novosphingobium sp.]
MPRSPVVRRYVSLARPSFLYVMYLLILWAIPLGLLAAVRPAAARSMTEAITAYFTGLPQPLYALFGAAYLGYTAARQYGKARGTDQ